MIIFHYAYGSPLRPYPKTDSDKDIDIQKLMAINCEHNSIFSFYGKEVFKTEQEIINAISQYYYHQIKMTYNHTFQSDLPSKPKILEDLIRCISNYHILYINNSGAITKIIPAKKLLDTMNIKWTK